MNDDWEEAELTPVWDFESNKELIGVYESKKENVGKFQSSLYNFKVDGKIVSFWGNSVLDNKFKNIPIGSEVMVVYRGITRSERTGKNYKNFSIFVKPMETQIPNEDIDPNEVGLDSDSPN